MSIFVLIPIVVLIGGFLFYKYQMNQHKAAIGDYTVENEYNNAESIKEDLLTDEFKRLKEKVGDDTIVAFTECLYITDIKSQFMQGAKETLSKIGAGLVGVRLTYHEKPNAAFVVLTDKELHYMHFVEQKLENHLVFDKIRLSNACLEESTSQDMVTRKLNPSIKMNKLVFDIDGEKIEIILLGGVTKDPQIEYLYGKRSTDGNVMHKYFMEKMQNIYKF